MLVVTRHDGESVMVGDDIEIQVVRIDHHSVRLAIRAPDHVTIYRTELLSQADEQLDPARPQKRSPHAKRPH